MRDSVEEGCEKGRPGGGEVSVLDCEDSCGSANETLSNSGTR